MKSVRQEKGMVLLMVLVVVALLTSLLTEFAFSTLVDMRLTETFRDSTRAYYLAKGGLRAGRVILHEDRNKGYHHPNDMWAQGIANYPIGDEGAISIQFEDLSGKLNINGLVFRSGNPNATHKDRLIRLLEEFFPGGNSAEAAIDAIIDWITENGPLNSLEELGLIEEFPPDMISLMRPHITVYGPPQGSADSDVEEINVNTASAEVLMSLAEEMDRAAVEAIIALRNAGPIQAKSAINDLIPVIYPAIHGNISVRSSVFRIMATAAVNDGSRTLEAIVDRTGSRLYYMKVH